MNARTTALLFLVLVVLAGAAFFIERNRDEAFAPSGDALFPEMDIAQVDGIELRNGNNETRLARRSGQWIVLTEDEKPADPKLAEDLLSDLDGLLGTDLVSENPANHPNYEVDETGVETKITEGGKDVAHFIVGKPGADFKSTYIRKEGSDNTYRVPVYLRTRVDRGGQTWRQQNILRVDAADVLAYTTMAEDTVRVEQIDGRWRVVRPFAGDARPDIMGVIVRSLTQVKASAFDDTIGVAAAGLDDPGRVIEIEMQDGTRHRLEIGGETPSRQSYTRLRGDDQIYLVPIGRWNTIFREPAEFATPDPAPADTTTAG